MEPWWTISSSRVVSPSSHGSNTVTLKGSDHCPIYIDLPDEIVLNSGVAVTLSEATHMHADPPRIAARLWDDVARVLWEKDGCSGG